jgi:RNA polymerase sigma-70 factor, ECF subfamily
MELYTQESKHMDLELWMRIKASDEKAFEILFKKYREPLLNYSTAYLTDITEREEILQDVFSELYIKKNNIHIKDSVASYLFSFLRNRIKNHLRRHAIYKHHVRSASQLQNSYDTSTDEFIVLRETRSRINQSLARLPQSYRDVYVLNKDCQFTLTKIAQALNRPVSTIEKQLRKTLGYLRSELKQ